MSLLKELARVEIEQHFDSGFLLGNGDNAVYIRRALYVHNTKVWYNWYIPKDGSDYLIEDKETTDLLEQEYIKIYF